MLTHLKLSMRACLRNYLVKIKQPRLVYPSETLNMVLTITMTFHQVNQDAAGPLTAASSVPRKAL